MCLLQTNLANGQSTLVQKRIQVVTIKQKLWPPGGVQLDCEKPKCGTCQLLATYTVCVKKRECDLCKEAKDHNGHYTKQRIYNTCNFQKRQCQCVITKYCI